MKQISVKKDTKEAFRAVLREMQVAHEKDLTENSAIKQLIDESEYGE